MKKIIPLLIIIGLTMNVNVKANSELNSLDDVRVNIDHVDGQIISLLKQRQDLVKKAASFKKDESSVRDQERVEVVIKKIIGLAGNNGLDTEVAEKTYRAMIGAFINLELKEHTKDM